MKHLLASVLVAACLTWKQTLGDARVGVCHVCNCTDVKVVDCASLRLAASFHPSSWSELGGANATLREINLGNNLIGHVTQFPSLPVTKLSLRSNKIVKIDNKAFHNLTHLLDLDLGDNELTTANLVPEIFAGPYSPMFYQPLPIRHLDLSGNELHSLSAYLFEHLPYVRYLSLRKNPLGILDHPTIIAISTLQRLEVLDLSFAQLRELPTGFLHSVRNLSELNLGGNHLEQLPSDVLREGRNLRVLNLNLNPIKVISTERAFPRMNSLKYLRISHMPELERIEKSSLRGLVSLERLDCKENPRLKYIDPLAFAFNDTDAERPNVTRLDLNDNALRHLAREFVNVNALTHANVVGNIWSCDCDNQWMVTELVPILIRTKSPVGALQCSEPSAMAGRHFLSLYKSGCQMRCLDYYGNHPENDSVILITVFSIIIGVMAVALVLIWKSKLGNCRRRGRPNYSRAFYKPAQSDDRDGRHAWNYAPHRGGVASIAFA